MVAGKTKFCDRKEDNKRKLAGKGFRAQYFPKAVLAARLLKEVVLIMKQQLKSGINELIDKIIDNYLMQEP